MGAATFDPIRASQQSNCSPISPPLLAGRHTIGGISKEVGAEQWRRPRGMVGRLDALYCLTLRDACSRI